MDHDANHKIIVMLVATISTIILIIIRQPLCPVVGTNWTKQKQICVKVVASMASKSFDLASNWLQDLRTQLVEDCLKLWHLSCLLINPQMKCTQINNSLHTEDRLLKHDKSIGQARALTAKAVSHTGPSRCSLRAGVKYFLPSQGENWIQGVRCLLL